jgi:hypothetical protein
MYGGVAGKAREGLPMPIPEQIITMLREAEVLLSSRIYHWLLSSIRRVWTARVLKDSDDVDVFRSSGGG